MTEFRMPSLGADMEAGTLVQWLKQPGDALVRGDIIAVVDTDKGAIEIEVFEAGLLDRVLVAPGQKVPVGTALALIRSSGEAPSSAAAPPVDAVPAPPRHERRASPAARKAAEALNIDLAGVMGTGPGGAISREDVERAASRGQVTRAPAAGSSAPAAPTAGLASAVRSAITAAMSRSKREIPHLYLSTTIDMTNALAWLAAENQKRSVERRVLPVALLVRAVATAAAAVPGLSGFWVNGTFRAGAGMHVGCAISLRGGGLVAPALHDADRKDLDTIMGELADLIGRARRGTLRSSELADPTITVTNLGDLGVETAFAIIYPPQVAIIGFGKTVQRPWIVDGRVEPRTVLTATISADHRAVDGRRAGQFLAVVDRRLQTPDKL
ncbi:MAG: dihydrolipoamide acetyltransferase family protein [Vicinamibacterales bacterium]